MLEICTVVITHWIMFASFMRSQVFVEYGSDQRFLTCIAFKEESFTLYYKVLVSHLDYFNKQTLYTEHR